EILAANFGLSRELSVGTQTTSQINPLSASPYTSKGCLKQEKKCDGKNSFSAEPYHVAEAAQLRLNLVCLAIVERVLKENAYFDGLLEIESMRLRASAACALFG